MYRIDTGAAIDQASCSQRIIIILNFFFGVEDPKHFSLLTSQAIDQPNTGVHKETVLAVARYSYS
jgi:hypothetical protein